MTQLVQEKCVACRRDAPRVTEAEIAELHPIIADWDLIEVDGVNRLRRSFRFRNFQQAMDFSTATIGAHRRRGGTSPHARH